MMKSPGGLMYHCGRWGVWPLNYKRPEGVSVVDLTVGDYLTRLVEEEGIPLEEYMETWLGAHVSPSVPQRYKRLVRDVALTLPQGWDDHAEWTVELGSEENPRGYACTLPFEEEAGEMVTPYTVKIFSSRMDRLSDSACRWVFAHEFGHIASKLRSGSIVIHGKPYTRLRGDEHVEAAGKNTHEDAADQIALAWGFDRELQAFLDED